MILIDTRHKILVYDDTDSYKTVPYDLVCYIYYYIRKLYIVIIFVIIYTLFYTFLLCAKLPLAFDT